MSILVTIFIFLLGLCVGSFLNVLIYRLYQRLPILGRSFCPHCQRQLAWFNNIPLLSFILLGGRCRYCRKKISIQYPLIEISIAFLFIFIFLKNLGLPHFVNQFSIFNFQFSILRDCFFAAVLVFVFAYDLKYGLVEDKVVLPAAGIALVANLFLGQSLILLLIGAIIGVGFFALQFFLSKRKAVGAGDIRLGLLMGLMLGWPYIIVALIISYLVGSLISIVLLILKKKKMTSRIPLGPFLAVGTLTTLFWGERILSWYLKLF